MPKKLDVLANLSCVTVGVCLGWALSKWLSWSCHQLVQLLWPIGRLRLKRPLVTFDIESTGLNVTRDRMLEIAAIKLLPDGTVQVKGPQRLNPGIAISDEVTAIHGISAADVEGCPRFEQVAAEWKEFLTDCDLHGYNAKKFDVPMLRNEFRRCGIPDFPVLGVPVVDSFRIFSQQEPRNLAAAVQFYCGRPFTSTEAHSALGDAQATLRVLLEQVRRYRQLPCTVAGLADLCSKPSRAQDITGDGKFQWRSDVPILGFGKYQGEPLAVMITQHKDYLRWMSGQDYSDEALIVVQQALQGLLPTKDGAWEELAFTDSQPALAAGAASGAACEQSAAAPKTSIPTSDSQGLAVHNGGNSHCDPSKTALKSLQGKLQQQSDNALTDDSGGTAVQLNSSGQQHSYFNTSTQQHQQQQQQQQQQRGQLYSAGTGPCGWPEHQAEQSANEDSWGAAAHFFGDGNMMDHTGTPREICNPSPQAVQDD